MMRFETVTLLRDCEAAQIPSGEKFTLPKGAHVHITQSLGGSFTIMTEYGSMARVEGGDADALGKENPKAEKEPLKRETAGVPLEQMIWNELRTCYDPEIPVNIVDLGLIYECAVTSVPEDPVQKDVRVKMTLTAPGCGMGDVLRDEAMRKIERLPGVRNIRVDLVWEPQWDRSMMSDAAKLQLGMM